MLIVHYCEEVHVHYCEEVQHFDIMSSTSTYDLPLHNFPSGVYIYVLNSKSNKAVSGKFIKQ